MDVLDRYEPIVEDPAAFRSACDRPLPAVVRVNPIAATPAIVRRAFDETGVGYERVEWHDGLFRLDRSDPGNTWPYVHGWVHGQEEVSAVPPVVLDPRPGDRVLDACAAPGSKTTQLAGLMADEGTLVANDANLARLAPLRTNAQRCGITNVLVTNRDARDLSIEALPIKFPRSSDGRVGFDRALVDAPCSCEGTVRKNPDALDGWDLDRVRGVAGLQKGILTRTVELTRPGGVVVYATCTFAPEENEAVLDHAVDRTDCRPVAFDLPLVHRSGVVEWDGESFDDRVRHAKRIYPHYNDTGGFFVAKLEVTG